MLIKIIDLLKKYKFLILILTIGIGLRLYNITNLPPALNWDEASHGYNAYSIIKSGQDEWGETYPLIFRAYGDYKLPVYIYSTALSIAVFGANIFSVRLTSVLAGIFLILFTYLLTRELLSIKKNGTDSHLKHLPLLAAFLVAVEPWSLFLSRGAFEANLATFFFVSAIYFFLRSFKSSKLLLLSATLFGLTVWTYNSYRVFTPLMLTLVIFFYRVELLKIYIRSKIAIYISMLILGLFFVPMFIQFTDGPGQARYEKVAILDEGAINKINEQRNLSEYPHLITRILYNRPTYFAITAANNWLQHFSLNFLFFDGGDQYQYSVPDHGLIYLINIPFLLIGALFLIREAIGKKKRYALLILSWLIFAPIPASITRDSPHALRTITILPIPMILSAFGVVTTIHWLKKKVSREKDITIISYFSVLIYLVVVTISLANYWKVYTNEYRNNFSWSWQYGYEKTVDIVKGKYDKYEKIIYTKRYGEPHIFLLFYWPWHPESYINDQNLIRFEQSDWFWVDRFDKFYFVNDWEIPTESDQDFVLESGEEFDCDFSRCLLITSPGTVQQDWDLLETVYFLEGTPAFEIYEN